jgi:hypothetical protein
MDAQSMELSIVASYFQSEQVVTIEKCFTLTVTPLDAPAGSLHSSLTQFGVGGGHNHHLHSRHHG